MKGIDLRDCVENSTDVLLELSYKRIELINVTLNNQVNFFSSYEPPELDSEFRYENSHIPQNTF